MTGRAFQAGRESASFVGNKTITGSLAVTGQIKADDGSPELPSISFAGDPTTGFYQGAGGRIDVSLGTSRYYAFIDGDFYVLGSQKGIILGAGADVILRGEASNILAQRNGATAQKLRVYGSYTDGSNYDRVVIDASSGGVSIGTERAGTGGHANLAIGTGGSGNLTFYTVGGNRWKLGGDGNWVPYGTYGISLVSEVIPPGGAFLLGEIGDPGAPSANQVVLYARDNGGKTELVARFPTGVIQQVAIEP